MTTHNVDTRDPTGSKNSNNTPMAPRLPRYQHCNTPTYSNKLQQYSNTLQHYNIPTLQHTTTFQHTHSKHSIFTSLHKIGTYNPLTNNVDTRDPTGSNKLQHPNSSS